MEAAGGAGSGTSQSQRSIAVLPSIRSSHFSLAETDFLENFDKEDTDAEEDEYGARRRRVSGSSGGADTGSGGGGVRRRRVKIEQPPPGEMEPPGDEDSLLEYFTTKYNRDRRTFLILFCCLTAITIAMLSLIIYIVTAWLSGFNFHPDSSSDDDFNLHLIVMVFGSLMLPAYGMLIFRAFPNVSYAKLVNFHIAINVTALLLTVFGIKVAYDAHHIYAKKHLYSLHSWFGFTIFILQFFELITGNWLYFRNFAQPIMKYLHMAFGSIIFVWSGAAVSTGLMYRTYNSLMINGDEDDIRNKQFLLNGFGLLSALFAILVRYLCGDQRFRRQKLPQKDSTLGYNKMRLEDSDPFTQDTFEYGRARKSIFVGAEELTNSSNTALRVLAPGSGSDSDVHFEGTSVFYGPSQRRGTLTKKSITHELAKLSVTRETQAQATAASSAHGHDEEGPGSRGPLSALFMPHESKPKE